MRCTCEECHGRGTATCEECNGEGMVETSIETAEIDKNHTHCEALKKLQADARRVRRQFNQLLEAKPEHGDSYRSQLRHATTLLNKEAEAVLTGKTPCVTSPFP